MAQPSGIIPARCSIAAAHRREAAALSNLFLQLKTPALVSSVDLLTL